MAWGQRIKGFLQSLLQFKAAAFALASIAGFLLMIIFVLWWVNGASNPSNEESVAKQWNSAIAKLGLDPIYPPQEDIAVGDIFLILTDDALGEKASETLQGRSLKIWHVDLSADLKTAYKQTFIFPETAPRPKGNDEIWPQTVAQTSIFDLPTDRRHLPILILPDFTVAHVRRASGAVGFGAKLLNLVGVTDSEENRTIEIRIPSAETYGVSAIVANSYLNEFCSNPRSRPICTEEGARGFMSTLVGDLAFQRVPTGKPDGSTKFRLGVEILLVNRLYLTRSIESVAQTSSNFGVEAKAVSKVAEVLQALESKTQASGDAPAKPQPESAELLNLRQALEDHKSRLKAIMLETLGSSPAAISTLSASHNRIAVTQTLQRPVPIAFRAVRTRLLEQ
ncbi:hypothetical protein [Rhodoplanes elegans]|uniref:hypothetical protein n=1 Tax=Rhodoplanes elegans TaxID=29408 RepID=UPI0011B942DB|nr:hypothetical protein [Rhodoplanes elegans]